MKVLITGVSSGIGKALAVEFLNRGFQVYGLSRREPKELLERDTFHFISCDLSDRLETPIKLQKLCSGVQEFEYVILNAGVLGQIENIKDADIDNLNHCMNVNVWANKVILDTLVDMNIIMRQVIAISSGAAVSGSKGWSGYGVSKAALNMLIKLYASELPETHFCAFAPGLVDTSMQDYLCALKSVKEYPTVERIQAARGTDDMPLPRDFARHAVDIFPKLTTLESGSFQDIRKLNF